MLYSYEQVKDKFFHINPNPNEKWLELDLWDEDKKDYYIHMYLDDDSSITFGPYSNYTIAKEAYERIIDDNVNTKYPSMREPLTADKANIDGCIALMASLLKESREVYIAYAKDCKKYGLPIPTSVADYDETDYAKKVRQHIDEQRDRIKHIRHKIEQAEANNLSRPEIELLYSDLHSADNRLKHLQSQMEKRRFIKFLEDGAYGALDILSSGISGTEIMKEWKMEALYGKRERKDKYPGMYVKGCDPSTSVH